MNSSITVLEWLESSARTLGQANIETPRLDSLILLEDCLKLNRANILAHSERTLTTTQLKRLNIALNRRLNHEPLAYIRGVSEFYGRRFFVSKSVLIPRPESETVISELLSLSLPKHPIIADIGTGSGVLGITAALELPYAKVDLYDVSQRALKVAQRNSDFYNLKLNTIRSDLLIGLKRKADVLLVNLPYVPLSYPVNSATKYEPRLSLYAGKDGLDSYRRFWRQLADIKASPLVLTECLPFQHDLQKQLAAKVGFSQIASNDFIQAFR